MISKFQINAIIFSMLGVVFSQEVLANSAFSELIGTVVRSARVVRTASLTSFSLLKESQGLPGIRTFTTSKRVFNEETKIDTDMQKNKKISDLLHKFYSNCLTETRIVSPELANIGQSIVINAETLLRMKMQGKTTQQELVRSTSYGRLVELTGDWSATFHKLRGENVNLQGVKNAQLTLYEIGKTIEYDALDYHNEDGILSVSLIPTIE